MYSSPFVDQGEGVSFYNVLLGVGTVHKLLEILWSLLQCQSLPSCDEWLTH